MTTIEAVTSLILEFEKNTGQRPKRIDLSDSLFDSLITQLHVDKLYEHSIPTTVGGVVHCLTIFGVRIWRDVDSYKKL